VSKGFHLLRYLCHAALASYGVLAINFVIEFLIGEMVGSYNRFLDYVFFGPTFLIPVLMGLIIGYYLGKSLPALSSRLIFLIPLFLMAYEVWISVKYGLHDGTALKNITDNFFGVNCSASECLGELVNTAPLFSSVAYAIGAEIGRYLHPVKARGTTIVSLR
jgi:hypothetical protein